MQDLINKLTVGLKTKTGKRGVLVYDADGRPLDLLLEVRGRQTAAGDGPAEKGKASSQHVALIGKGISPPVRVASAKDVPAAKKVIDARAKSVAARAAKAK